jgi:hypothetical protein
MRRIPTPRIPTTVAECIPVAVIAAGTAWAWLYLAGARTLTVGAVIACAAITVAVDLALEAAIRRVRRGRPRRAHARTTPTNPRKNGVAS